MKLKKYPTDFEGTCIPREWRCIFNLIGNTYLVQFYIYVYAYVCVCVSPQLEMALTAKVN